MCSVCIWLGFSSNARTFCAAQTTYLILIGPDFPCLADGIAEPRPDMNIKVAAFTVSDKFINIKSKVPIKHEIQMMDKSIRQLMTPSITVYFQKFEIIVAKQ